VRDSLHTCDFVEHISLHVTIGNTKCIILNHSLEVSSQDRGLSLMSRIALYWRCHSLLLC